MKLLIVVLFLIVHSQLDDKLVFVMTHFRHGARAPTTLKNNIDDNGEEWLIPGELTAVGERMHYLLGLRNRVRYINEKKFLSEKFNSKELEVIPQMLKEQLLVFLHICKVYIHKVNN